ncbi:MAG: rod shape-determining protein MreD [Oleibacter sp.]|nr:rod shape-determining protein MreD [Thalassolituus sp.]
MRGSVLGLFLLYLFGAFALEHAPMPEMISWLQPAWVMLVVTIMVLLAPQVFGLWLAFPIGLLMDVEQGTLIGVHVLLVAIHIVILQLLYRRIYLFNVLQQSLVIFLMIMAERIVQYWTTAMVDSQAMPVPMLWPALISAVIWPWIYALLYRPLRRMQ